VGGLLGLVSMLYWWWHAGLEHEVNAGIMSTSVTRMPYCMCYVRHIDGIEYHLSHELAPKYVDVIELNNIRTIDRAKNRRLQELKVSMQR